MSVDLPVLGRPTNARLSGESLAGASPEAASALRAHRTQVSDAHPFVAMEPRLAERFLGTEWFAPLGGASDWLAEAVAGE